MVPSYWTADADKFIAAKIADRQVYERQLRVEFEANVESVFKE
jgi:hypothetical protein